MRLVKARVVAVLENDDDVQHLLVRYPVADRGRSAELKSLTEREALNSTPNQGDCQAAEPLLTKPEALTETKALNYLALNRTCASGDEVLINTTGLDLRLGTGGLAFVLPTSALELPAHTLTGTGGHIIKLRYTPLQRECATVEEQGSRFHDLLKRADSLQGLPVVCCELHSQMPLVAAAARQVRPDARIVYCMTDQAALPLPLSDLARHTRAVGMIDSTISCGQAFGGELEAVNTYSGLLAARSVAQADVAIVAPGPGSVGTGTRMGHSGVGQGEALNAVSALGGQAVAVLRVSWADGRLRHQVLSHHSVVALGHVSLAPARVALPASLNPRRRQQLEEALDVAGLRQKHNFSYVELNPERIDLRGIAVKTMGRDRHQDPEFFAAAFAAGILAARLLPDAEG
ncbi:MAG: DUF3866 family protein [Coriobacteriales bacterium]|jgi:hypothetical protein|nr:DUF3866 family protein [Coriobacteriales bacterium]